MCREKLSKILDPLSTLLPVNCYFTEIAVNCSAFSFPKRVLRFLRNILCYKCTTFHLSMKFYPLFDEYFSYFCIESWMNFPRIRPKSTLTWHTTHKLTKFSFSSRVSPLSWIFCLSEQFALFWGPLFTRKKYLLASTFLLWGQLN